MENSRYKFRAWDNVSGVMIEKYLYANESGRFIGYSTDSDSLTPMQYTGLKDKNGKEIYEGDIVRCWDNAAEDINWGIDKIHTGIIEYTPDCYSLKIPGKETYNKGSVKRWESDVFLPNWSNAENIEVIGNIYENPDLLSPSQSDKQK